MEIEEQRDFPGLDVEAEGEPFRPRGDVEVKPLSNIDLGLQTKVKKRKKTNSCLICPSVSVSCILFVIALSFLIAFATMLSKAILTQWTSGKVGSISASSMVDIANEDELRAHLIKLLKEGIISKNISKRVIDDLSHIADNVSLPLISADEDFLTNVCRNDTDIGEFYSGVNSSDDEVVRTVIGGRKMREYRDCFTILLAAQRSNSSANEFEGINKLQLGLRSSAMLTLMAKCDMLSFGGGWTVIQSRGSFENKPTFFNRTWDDYYMGFGDEQGEFWMGLLVIQAMTERYRQELLVQMWDDDGGSMKFARYSHFHLSNDGRFRIDLGEFTGNASDALSYSRGLEFSTFDKDHDLNPDVNCAKKLSGGWWFGDCAPANLNGLSGKGFQSAAEIFWMTPNDTCASRKRWARVEMKLRPVRTVQKSSRVGGELERLDLEVC